MSDMKDEAEKSVEAIKNSAKNNVFWWGPKKGK
jgi:hypothetical protein